MKYDAMKREQRKKVQQSTLNCTASYIRTI